MAMAALPRQRGQADCLRSRAPGHQGNRATGVGSPRADQISLGPARWGRDERWWRAEISPSPSPCSSQRSRARRPSASGRDPDACEPSQTTVASFIPAGRVGEKGHLSLDACQLEPGQPRLGVKELSANPLGDPQAHGRLWLSLNLRFASWRPAMADARRGAPGAGFKV